MSRIETGRLMAELDTAADAMIDTRVLSELVEAQLDEVAGGGYSQYACCHSKDAN
jgi:hypothetical protein